MQKAVLGVRDVEQILEYTLEILLMSFDDTIDMH